MLYYILFFALRVSSAAKQTCKIYHRQILYIIAVIVIFFCVLSDSILFTSSTNLRFAF